jgi:hypothetical protein
MQQLRQLRFARLDRLAHEFAPVELQEVEGKQHGVALHPRSVAQQFKHGKPLRIANRDLAIDDDGARRKASNCLRDQRKPLAKVTPISGQQTHTIGGAPRHDPVAVMLDLMNPPMSMGDQSLPALIMGNPAGGRLRIRQHRSASTGIRVRQDNLHGKWSAPSSCSWRSLSISPYTNIYRQGGMPLSLLL